MWWARASARAASGALPLDPTHGPLAGDALGAGIGPRTFGEREAREQEGREHQAEDELHEDSLS